MTGVPGLGRSAYGWWRLGASVGRSDFKSGAHIQCPLYPAYAEACIARAIQGVSFAIVNFHRKSPTTPPPLFCICLVQPKFFTLWPGLGPGLS